uniref:F-box domain-containing protein n=1 Tax=Leersia perrieri TaxID=77586 RepID=A0A0D9XQ96_9ORYZ
MRTATKPDARHLFDGMRPQGKTLKRGKGAPRRSSGGEEDRIGDLPDEILHHILGYLPAPDAVRTCVLARRWRHLWKSATALRISDCDEDKPVPMEKLQLFVHHLLLLRGRAPLDACELRFGQLTNLGVQCVNLWFRHAAMCDVRVLRLSVTRSGLSFMLGGLPLVSRHLAKLELSGVDLGHNFLDFSSCPVLEHLEIVQCILIDAKNIYSQSLKRLEITRCIFRIYSPTRIYVPNLLSLWLDDYFFRTPVFEVMPSLVEGFVKVLGSSEHSASCTSDSHGNTHCVLLQALSQAKKLVLIANNQESIFKRNLIQCPTFSNLKTLLLIDRACVAFDLHGITTILGHSPVLEKLTLEFSSKLPEHEDEVEMRGTCSQMERSSAISNNLKLVVVRCKAIDERITKILKFLSTFNISKISCNTFRSFCISGIFLEVHICEEKQTI